MAAGQFYFAWADSTETTFGPEHYIYEENIFSFNMTHAEGQFPTLELVIKNPGVGLLAPGRKIWAWFSFDTGSEVKPIFFGRVAGVPADMFGQKITVQFTAEPPDYLTIKQSVADYYKQLPTFDPIFIDSSHQNNPDTIIEARSELWHIDRTTLDVTLSDIIVGEDGVLYFPSPIYNSVKMTPGQAPLKTVHVEATVGWKQSWSDGFYVCKDLGVQGATAGDILHAWPKQGQSLGGGWVVTIAEAVDARNIDNGQNITLNNHYTNQAKTHNDGDLMEMTESFSRPAYSTGLGKIIYKSQTMTIGDPENGTEPAATLQIESFYVASYSVGLTLAIGYDASQPRTEKIVFNLSADLQDIITSPDAISITSVENLIVNGGSDISPYMGSTAFGSFFPTDRGQQSIEYLISLARAHLLLRARAVTINFDASFIEGLDLSCRHNAIVLDSRIPGGEASGKVISYTLSGDGSTGAFRTSVSLGCCIGKGNALSFADGTPTYCEGYVQGYRITEGQQIAVGSGDVGFTAPTADPTGIHFPLDKSQVLLGFTVNEGTTLDPSAVLNATPMMPNPLRETPVQAEQYLSELAQVQATNHYKQYPSWVELELVDLTTLGVDSAYAITTSLLVVPEQINLSAI